METKKASKILAVALSSAVIAVYGCGGGGGGGGGGGTPPPTYTTQQTPSSSAAASGTQGASVGTNAGQTLSNLAAVPGAPKYRSPLAGKDSRFNKIHAAEAKALKAPTRHMATALNKAKAARVAQRTTTVLPSETKLCAVSGSYTETISVNDNNTPSNTADDTYTIDSVYSNCREYDEQLNGSISITGSFSTDGFTFTETLGDGDLIVESTDFRVDLFENNYTNLYARYTASMTMGGSMAITGATFTYTANGVEEYSDFIDTFNLTFNTLQFTSSYAANYASGTDTITGGFSETWTDNGTNYGASMTFSSFAIAWAVGADYYEYSVDGTVTMDFTPDIYCTEGTYTIDTTTPIKINSVGQTIAGRMVINTNIIIVFNADGTITVTAPAGTTSTYESIETLEATCVIQDFESHTETEAVSSGGTVTTTGNTLLATLSWTGGDTSDMDLHLTHYTSATPASIDIPDWHLYYGSGPGGACADSVNYVFNDANSNGIYDTGDTIIATLDIDDCDGYGPEHITMDSLPTGYYVLYVDPFSLDADPNATITVTLNIGGTLYTFPTHTFTPSDLAEYRVADIKVESGVVTIKSPDTSLSLWAPGVTRAPKARR